MFNTLKRSVKYLINVMGYEIIPRRWVEIPDYKQLGFDKDFYSVYDQSKDYTMTSIERMYALYKAVNYIVDNQISGDIVECGVAAGGSMMLAALSLLNREDSNRFLYLYDTFQGMPKPTAKDVNYRGDIAMRQWVTSDRGDYNEWCYHPLEEVKSTMSGTGYPQENIVFVKGKVQDTIPGIMPRRIALLRLDTDWYESTFHELRHLYPLLVAGGVLIIDDYGHWEGCRMAVDKFFSKQIIKPLFNRIDRLGVIAIKQD